MAVQLFLCFPNHDDDILNLSNGRNALERILHTLMAVSRDIRPNTQAAAIILYDSRNIEVFLEKCVLIHEREAVTSFELMLKRILRHIGEDWRVKSLHIPSCNYVLWNFETFTIEPVLNTPLAEIAERMLTYPSHQYLLLNIGSKSVKRPYLPVFKDALHDKSLPRFAHIRFISEYDEWLLWWNFYREKTGLTQFSLLDKSRFRRTSLVEQGKPVYQELTTGYFWYLDNFHKNEYEVFDKRGHHIGVADLEGRIDEAQKDAGRTIAVN